MQFIRVSARAWSPQILEIRNKAIRWLSYGNSQLHSCYPQRGGHSFGRDCVRDKYTVSDFFTPRSCTMRARVRGSSEKNSSMDGHAEYVIDRGTFDVIIRRSVRLFLRIFSSALHARRTIPSGFRLAKSNNSFLRGVSLGAAFGGLIKSSTAKGTSPKAREIANRT